MKDPFVAIVDYDLGNLFSIQQACKKAGLDTIVTFSPDKIYQASAIILAGVGSFPRAMEILVDKGLVDVLHECVHQGKIIVGICLGMQLLMTESYEFGKHQGLNIIKGKVCRLKTSMKDGRLWKVPFIGWGQINSSRQSEYLREAIPESSQWDKTLLEGIPEGVRMYFVHSYFVRPLNSKVLLSKTRYGDNDFCSAFCCSNITAFQFHPECSGSYGLKIYQNLAERIFILKNNASIKGGVYV